MAITSGTVVQITVAHIAGAVVAFMASCFGMFFTVEYFENGSVRNDVSEIRKSIEAIHGADKDTVIRFDNTALALSGQMGNLSTQIADLRGDLKVTDSTVRSLNDRVDRITREPTKSK